jgi:hypothetical protein
VFYETAGNSLHWRVPKEGDPRVKARWRRNNAWFFSPPARPGFEMNANFTINDSGNLRSAKKQAPTQRSI